MGAGRWLLVSTASHLPERLPPEPIARERVGTFDYLFAKSQLNQNGSSHPPVPRTNMVECEDWERLDHQA